MYTPNDKVLDFEGSEVVVPVRRIKGIGLHVIIIYGGCSGVTTDNFDVNINTKVT